MTPHQQPVSGGSLASGSRPAAAASEGLRDRTTRLEPLDVLSHRLAGLRLEVLASFSVLAEELHFTRAAARLFISQPALSRRISLLERRLGVLLLHRTTRKVHLSEAGILLLPHVRGVVAAAGAIGLYASSEVVKRGLAPPTDFRLKAGDAETRLGAASTARTAGRP